jgi:hypothetical protein
MIKVLMSQLTRRGRKRREAQQLADFCDYQFTSISFKSSLDMEAHKQKLRMNNWIHWERLKLSAVFEGCCWGFERWFIVREFFKSIGISQIHDESMRARRKPLKSCNKSLFVFEWLIVSLQNAVKRLPLEDIVCHRCTPVNFEANT